MFQAFTYVPDAILESMGFCTQFRRGIGVSAKPASDRRLTLDWKHDAMLDNHNKHSLRYPSPVIDKIDHVATPVAAITAFSAAWAYPRRVSLDPRPGVSKISIVAPFECHLGFT